MERPPVVSHLYPLWRFEVFGTFNKNRRYGLKLFHILPVYSLSRLQNIEQYFVQQ